MRIINTTFILVVIIISGFKSPKSDNVEFVCQKTHKASNTCYFNFRIDGGKYSYTDVGCKRSRKKDDIVKKVKEGKLALAKDWKIDCPESKEE